MTTASDRDDVPVEMLGVDVHGRPLRDGITITRLPAGDWQVLSVFVGFDGKASSSVVWDLVEPHRSEDEDLRSLTGS